MHKYLLFLLVFVQFQILAFANNPPICDQAVSNPNSLWPPNHSFKTIAINGVSDPDGDEVEITIECIKQDEPVNGVGDGNTSHDGSGIGTSVLELRRERSGEGNGRVYHVDFSATDPAGASCIGSVLVGVPVSKNGPVVDGGALYDSVPQQGNCSGAPINNPPTITSFPVTNATATLNYSYDVNASDPEGDALVYSLLQSPSGMSIDPADGLITWTPGQTQVGDHIVEIQVSDSQQESDTQLYTLTVTELPNSAPQITSTPILEATVNQSYIYDVEAIDPDSDPLLYSLLQAPTGMLIDDASGLIEWVPQPNQEGSHPVTVKVTDVRGGSITQDFDVVVLLGNVAPEIVSSPSAQANATESWVYDVDAVDPDGDVLTYSLKQSPEGMGINASSGLISWVPDSDQQGQHVVEVEVADGVGGFANQLFEINVLPPPNQPPEITSQPNQEAYVGVLYEYQVMASDPDTGDTLTFSLTTAPTGMTIDSTSGLIQWTPDTGHAGHQDVTVLVSDAGGLTSEQGYMIAVEVLNHAPRITSTPVISVEEKTSYVYQVTANDSDGNSLVFSLPIGPVGMTIDPQSGLLNWSPVAEDIGVHDVSIMVTDPFGLSDVQNFSLEVIDVNDAPEIVSDPITNAAENSLYQYGVVAIDADNDNLVFTLDVAPTGMTIDSVSGLIEWLPGFDQSGSYPVSVKVEDPSGLSDNQNITLLVTNTNRAPSIGSLPVTDAVVGQDYLYVVDASDPDNDNLFYSLLVYPDGMTIDDQTGLIQWLPTQAGTVPVEITVHDGLGGSASQSFNLNVVIHNDIPQIAITQPANNIVLSETDVIAFRGYAFDQEDGELGQNIQWQSSQDGAIGSGASFLAHLSVGNHLITASITDSMQSSSSYQIEIVITEAQTPEPVILPPDPATVAPPIGSGNPVGFRDATSFLYSGADPIQTGVVVEDISAKRVSVLRGRVIDENAEPLSGVTVTINGHPELGQTLTREDGYFDMAVNGGSQLTANFSHSGFMSAQRTLEIPWRQHVNLDDDVVMLEYDPIANSIDLFNVVEPFQVAQGSIEEDLDGPRQAVILFPAGIDALMVFDDETSTPLNQMTVRATEFTVGAGGENNMPARLPNNSAYTYAVEFSVDQAVAAGARSVEFDTPLPVYINNFLGFPIGEAVPSAWYDYERAQWVPSENGIILQIVSIENGIAQLDVDGSGIPASEIVLSTLGISFEERQTIAGLFDAGESFWRIAIDHFTPWDFNWPGGLPDDAIAPPEEEPETEDEDKIDSDETDECNGCSIEAQNQVVRESIDIAGTPFSINYKSDRVSGRKTGRVINIPLSGDDIPGSLLGIEVLVKVAGQTIQEEFFATPNLSTSIEWDGKDAYGRDVPSALADVSVRYLYNWVYYSAPDDYAASFGVLARAGASGNRVVIGERNATTAILERKWSTLLTHLPPDSVGLGGWTLSSHHSYDPVSKTLYLGDGRNRTTETLGNIVLTIAGTGQSGSDPDGLPALETRMNFIQDIAFGPDGALYYLDGTARVRRINPTDSTVETVAGTGVSGFSGDGGLATDAAISAFGIDIDSNGLLYIADWTNNRVRVVDEDGIISTIAGTGVSTYNGDGIAATDANLNRPISVAVAQDGSIYIADSGNARVRRVLPGGTIHTVAGNGFSGSFEADNVLATTSQVRAPRGVDIGIDGSLYLLQSNNYALRRVLNDGLISRIIGNVQGYLGDGGKIENALFRESRDFTVGPDGSLYVADYGNQRIRKISPNGIVNTIIGTGVRADNSTSPGVNNGDLALNENLFGPSVVAVDQNGDVYYFKSYTIRKVTSALPGYSQDNLLIASQNGNDLYVFSSEGKHSRTIDSHTGTTLLEFTYTDEGLLESVTDIDGEVTIIERLSDGTPTTIRSQDGQTTDLLTDSFGYLDSVTNPANEIISMIYSQDGLMTQYTDARNNSNILGYDSLGRLTSDEDPEGGGWTISPDLFDDSILTFTSAEGRNSNFSVEILGTGERIQTSTRPDLTQVQTSFAPDETKTVITPDGSIISTKYKPDPRFGMVAAYPGETTISTPAGLVNSTTVTRSAVLMDSTDLLSHAQLSQTINTNGRTYTQTFDRNSSKYTYVSPEGRSYTETVDEKGRVTQREVPGLETIYFNYDFRGRLDTIVTGSGVKQRITDFGYDQNGFMANVLDAENRLEQFVRDPVGRIEDHVLADNRTLTFDYDENGNVTQISPPGRPVHGYGYSKVNQIASYDAPDLNGIPNTTTQYAYNLDRQPTSVTKASGMTMSYQYNATTSQRETLTIPRGIFDYNYDPATGQLTSVIAPGGETIEYGYDGILATSQTWSGTINGSVRVIYDNNFRAAQIGVNDGNIIFGFDNDNLLTSAGSLILINDPLNGLLKQTQQGDLTTLISYNEFAETGSISAQNSTETLYTVSYVRDNLGRVEQKDEIIDGATISTIYDYDLAGRLKQITSGSSNIIYDYDSNGNRTHINGSLVASYDDQDRLLQYENSSFTYTDDGDLLSKTDSTTNTVTTYTHDILHNLTQVELPGGTIIEYVIDAQSRRIGKKINGSLIQGFLYQDQVNPVAELDSNGNVISRFVYADKPFVPAYMIKGGQTYRFVTDQLGSPRLIVNTSDGSIVQRIDYDEWGNVLVDTNPGFQPFGFAGGIYDSDTQLLKFGARDYDPLVGRWIQSDPIGLVGGENVYAYVKNDPVNKIDPLGLDSFDASRENAMRNALDGMRKTGNEHACAVCCTPNPPGHKELLNCHVGPMIEGDEDSVQDVPKCRYGMPEEYVHSHPEGEPTISDKDIRTSKKEGVPVTAVEPGGRGSRYVPGSGSVPHFDHDL